MRIVISPAKTLDYLSPLPTSEYSLPAFKEDSLIINKSLKKLSAKKLSGLMDISKPLAELNFARNQAFTEKFTLDNSRQAIFAFKGDVYLGLDAYTIPVAKFEQLSGQLRILSGLYGLLKPFDLIQPYRLEMGTSLKVGRRANLYKYWEDKISPSLQSEMGKEDVLLNLASQEYFGAVNLKTLKREVISPVFLDFVNGSWKVVSFYAKKARGLMLRYILDHNITDAENILAFDYENYAYSPADSTPTSPVFKRLTLPSKI